MNDKFTMIDVTDEIIIGGFGNLEGNLGLLKYNKEDIRKMITENNNGNDNIRLINSLLQSLKELQQENKILRENAENNDKVVDKVNWENQLLKKENQQLKKKLEEEQKEYDRIFSLWHNRKLIKKFDDEYDEEDKMKNPNRDYACVCPDAEEVYKRYYKLKEQLQQKEDIINKAKEYIENNPLYDIDVYEYSICLNGIDDEQTRKELLEILDNKGE